MKRKQIQAYLLIAIAAAVVALILYAITPSRRGNDIHIAYGGPGSGEGAAQGRLMTRAIRLYLDKINNEGGIRGKKVVLDIFDDENDPEKAARNAVKMGEENTVLAVIGHWYSSCSMAAGGLYEKYKIPAVTPGSSHMEVTGNNEWYFRTYLNINLACDFLLMYIRDVLGAGRIAVIHEDGTYLKHAGVIEKKSPEAGLDVAYIRGFAVGADDLDQTLDRIVEEVKTRDDADLILLLVQAHEGVGLLKRIKDAGIRTPVLGLASFSEKTFINGFQDFADERKNPGHYTNGVRVVTPLIFDTANEEAQALKQRYQDVYGETPDWSIAYAYDSAKVIIEAMRHGGVEGKPGTRERDRKRIRDYLASLDTAAKAVPGATGLTCFNEKGDADKPIYIGVYRNGSLISESSQVLLPLQFLEDLPDLEKAREQKQVIQVGDSYFYLTNVVHVGVEFNKIGAFDFETMSCFLDFHIWFRFHEEIEAWDITFLNALEPIRLTSSELVKRVRDNGLIYQLHRVKGRFETDFIGTRRGDGVYRTIGFQFRHRSLNRNSLVYVTDVLGMGLDGAPSFAERMKDGAVLDPASGYAIDDVFFFQDISKKSTMGDLNFLNNQNKFVDCSRFNVLTRIKKEGVLPRRKIPREASRFLLVAAAAALLLLVVAGRSTPGRFARTFCFSRVVFALLILLSAEVVVLHWPMIGRNADWTSWGIRAFDILWWVVPARLAVSSMESFIWAPLQRRTGRPVPDVLHRLARIIIDVIMIYGIIAFVFDQNINKLMATSGVIAMVIGFIVKANISDFFAGIMINQGSAVRMGDWVRVGSIGEGKVMDITWRATRLQVIDGSLLTIPNSSVLGTTVYNYNFPEEHHSLEIVVELDPVHRYERAQKILLDAAFSVKDVLKDPGPIVVFKGQGDFGDRGEASTRYGVTFSVRDRGRKEGYKSAVWKRAWTHLAFAGIQLARVPEIKGIRWDGDRVDSLSVLETMDFFDPLSHEERSFLSPRMRHLRVPTGEPLPREGDGDDSLCILLEGAVGVWMTRENGESMEVARRGAGDIVGEMALYDCSPREVRITAITETVLLRIAREDLAPFMEKRPELAERLAGTRVEYTCLLEAQQEADPSHEKEKEPLYSRLGRKLRHGFGAPGS